MTQPFSNATFYIAQLRQAENLIMQGALKEAALELNVLLAKNPNDPRLFILGARLAQASGNKPGQLSLARRAHALAPNWPMASLYLAGVLANSDQPQEALELARRSVQDAATQQTTNVEQLKQAASLAQSLSQASAAHEWLRMAEMLEPKNDSVQYQLGLLEINLNLPTKAIDRFSIILEKRPSLTAVLTARMRAYLALPDNALAISDGELILSLDPSLKDDVGLYLAVALGAPPSTLPSSVIKDMFDGMAATFDQHLVADLKYSLPRDVANHLLALYPERDCDILDLGCGTGLLGVALGPMKGVVVGVDLSELMVEQAARHGVYDKFHIVNILDALKATPSDQYHVITALDVLIYVGALDQVIPDALRILLPGGRLVFSCERANDEIDTFQLTSAFRYAHKQFYVEQQLGDAGFVDVVIEEKLIRHERGEPVNGYLVVAQRPKVATPKPSKTAAKNLKQSAKSTKAAT